MFLSEVARTSPSELVPRGQVSVLTPLRGCEHRARNCAAKAVLVLKMQSPI